MSPAALPTAPPIDAGAEYVTLASACRLTGRTHTQIRTLAALGRVRVDALPGCRVRYHRGDLMQATASRPAGVAC